jgi:hypothetical protein
MLPPGLNGPFGNTLVVGLNLTGIEVPSSEPDPLPSRCWTILITYKEALNAWVKIKIGFARSLKRNVALVVGNS